MVYGTTAYNRIQVRYFFEIWLNECSKVMERSCTRFFTARIHYNFASTASSSDITTVMMSILDDLATVRGIAKIKANGDLRIAAALESGVDAGIPDCTVSQNRDIG
jgi:hypothetical protein